MSKYEGILLTIYNNGYELGKSGKRFVCLYAYRPQRAMFTKGWQAGRKVWEAVHESADSV